jgi:RND superfamily putative drug exporter
MPREASTAHGRAVFATFMLGSNLIVKTFGFGLAFAVRIDAFIVRSVLVPALMHLIGPANWTMTAWLDRILPNVFIENEGERFPAREAS